MRVCVLGALLCTALFLGTSASDCDCRRISLNGAPEMKSARKCDCQHTKHHSDHIVLKRWPRHQQWSWDPFLRNHMFPAVNILPPPMTALRLHEGFYPVPQPVYAPTLCNWRGATPPPVFTPSWLNQRPPSLLPNQNTLPGKREHTQTDQEGFRNSFNSNQFMDVGVYNNNHERVNADHSSTGEMHENFMNCMDLHLALAQMQKPSNQNREPWNRSKVKGFHSIDEIKEKIETQCKGPQQVIQDNVQAIINAQKNLRSEAATTAPILTLDRAGLASFYEESTDSEVSDTSNKDRIIIPVVSVDKPKDYETNEVRGDLEYSLTTVTTTESPASTETSHQESDHSTPTNVPTITTVDTIQNPATTTTSSPLESTESTTTMTWDSKEPIKLDEQGHTLDPKMTDAALRQESNEFESIAQGTTSTGQQNNQQMVGESNFGTTPSNFVNVAQVRIENLEKDTALQLDKIITGKMIFLHNDENIPMQFKQNRDGYIDLGINGNYLCQRLMEDPLKYNIILSALCKAPIEQSLLFQ